jgi:hypothetical protein
MPASRATSAAGVKNLNSVQRSVAKRAVACNRVHERNALLFYVIMIYLE